MPKELPSAMTRRSMENGHATPDGVADSEGALKCCRTPCRSAMSPVRHNQLVETDAQRHGATRRARDHAPCGAMPLRAAHRRRWASKA